MFRCSLQDVLPKLCGVFIFPYHTKIAWLHGISLRKKLVFCGATGTIVMSLTEKKWLVQKMARRTQSYQHFQVFRVKVGNAFGFLGNMFFFLSLGTSSNCLVNFCWNVTRTKYFYTMNFPSLSTCTGPRPSNVVGGSGRIKGYTSRGDGVQLHPCVEGFGWNVLLMATRNPAKKPVDMINILLFAGFHGFWVVVWDF